ncbi:MAG: hypothetical protein ACFNKL_00590 [Treponema sp.]
MKKTILLLCALFICSQFIFAKKSKQPVWVSNPYDGYEESKYIAASAGGKTADDADKKAVISVAANVIQDINAEESVVQNDSGDGKNLTSYLANIRTNSKLKDLSGMSVKNRWTAKDGTVYSRAVLDKNAAARYYSLLLNKNSIEIETLIEDGEKTSAPFDTCKLLVKAYSLAEQNNYYAGLLSVLQPSAHRIFSYGSPAAIESKLRAALSKITVAVNVSGDTDNRLAAAASSVITGFGIGTENFTQATDAAYTLGINALYEDLEKSDSSDIYFTRSIVNCSLIENTSGKEILSVSSNSRQGKLSRKEAVQSALRSAERSITEDFANKFGELFN